MKTDIKFKRYINNDPFQRKEIRFYSIGSKQWWLNGKLHREDGPAIEYSDGAKSWYLNGNLHREDGPAIEWNDGSKQWYLNNKRFSEKEYLKAVKKIIHLQ